MRIMSGTPNDEAKLVLQSVYAPHLIARFENSGRKSGVN